MRHWRKFLPIVNMVLIVCSGVLTALCIADYVEICQSSIEMCGSNPKEPPSAKEIRVPDFSRAVKLMHFKNVVKRNLFSPDRKDWDSKKQAKEKLEAKSPNKAQLAFIKKLKVRGIIKVGGVTKALVIMPERKGVNQYRFLQKGDELAGCQVKGIEPGGIIVDCDGNVIRKPMREDNSKLAYSIKEQVDKSYQPDAKDNKEIAPAGNKELKAKGGSRQRSGMERKGGPFGGRGGHRSGKDPSGLEAIKSLFELMKSIENNSKK